MATTNLGKAEYLIQESGCGLFQILMVLTVNVIGKVVCSYIMMFMAFGNYNPGWRCADVNTTTSGTAYVFHNVTTFETAPSGNETVGDFNGESYPHTTDSCSIYESCQNIEFVPGTSTIVTEWGLVCGKAWISSVVISLQMAGVVVGSFLSGQLGDTFGRKKLFFMALILAGVSTISSVFAPNWQVFAALKFIVGIALACLFTMLYILPAEYLTNKWRSILVILPSWHVSGIVFGVTAMVFEDWRVLHIIGGGMALASCLLALWVPESLRWLEVQRKDKEFERVASRLISVNKLKCDLKLYENETLSKYDKTKPVVEKAHIYTIFDIFRKGYRIYSIVIGFVWFVPFLVYYAIGFGVKAMYGNFYINLIIVFAIDVPFTAFPSVVITKMGRRGASVLFFSTAALCLVTATGFELWAPIDIKNIGTLILTLIGKLTIHAGLSAVMVLTSEIYPTVARSIGVGYASFIGRFGGVASPFLIPQDEESVYICYGVMGFLSLICCVLMFWLPETKGKELKEYFDEDNEG